MYRAFNVKISSLDIMTTKTINYDDKKDEYKTKLLKLVNSSTELKAEYIKNTLLPNNEKFDIFISHSHRDLELAKKLAAYLKERFNLNCFIDSMYWDNISNLLNALNNQHSRNTDSTNTYNYSKCNNACKHCDMILASALTNMIDNCEAVFFLNTENSVVSGEKAVEGKETYSPWIYHEIFTTSIIEKHAPERTHNLDAITENFSTNGKAQNKDLKIRYEIDLSNFPVLDKYIIQKWVASNIDSQIVYSRQPKNEASLDKLYEILPV